MKAGARQPEKTAMPPVSWPSAADFIVILLCAAFALQLGILQPAYHFQAIGQKQSASDSATSATAYAAGNSILIFMQQGNSSTTLVAKGSGTASSLQLAAPPQGTEISGLSVNGRVACGPCNSSKKYPLENTSGSLLLEIKTAAIQQIAQQQNISHFTMPFFDVSEKTQISPQLTLSFNGWSAAPNAEMPSSFYGVDAPFHISRISVLADYLSNLSWPWAGYTFFSAIPPALLCMASGITPEYAYKIYEMALFFIPIILFRLFSSKLAQGREAAFLLSSLIYLFMPSRGLITGSGTDLFILGMTAYTLATYLSLFSLYFAYEFVFEKKAPGASLAAVFFALATFSNQRILLPLCIGLAVLLALAATTSRARRAILVAAACFFAVAWFTIPYFLSMDAGGYSRLGGADTSRAADALLGFFFIGYLLLPLLFTIGMFEAFRQRGMFPLFISAAGILTYAVATSPALNQQFPFMDGLRLLPSFFLPAFFISGMGAAAIFRKARSLVAAAAAHLGMDQHTSAIAFMMAFSLPFAVMFFTVALATTAQYSSSTDSILAASEYYSLQQAYSIIGNERALFLPGNAFSQYPVFIQHIGTTIISYYSPPSELAQRMEAVHAKYLILGNSEQRQNSSGKSREQEYSELKGDPDFSEMPLAGPFRLFRLNKNISTTAVEFNGGTLLSSSLQYDSAKLAGTCNSAACNATIFSLSIPTDSKCTGAAGCAARFNATSASFEISNIPQGRFEISLAPQHSNYFLPSIALSALLLAACVYLACKID